MRQIKNHIQDLDIAEGNTYRGSCPWCGGYNTFTATKEDGMVIYNCFKVSCNLMGGVSTGMTAQEIQARLNPNNDKETYEIPLLTWPEYVVTPTPEHSKFKRFVNRWGLENEDLMYDVKDERVVFPIHLDGRLIDAIGRATSYTGQVKWLRYARSADVYTRTFGKPNGTVVLVEDVISAFTVAKQVPGVTGMAILGTSLGTNKMHHLGDYNRVIIALDPDASLKALQFKKEIEAWTGLETQAMRLDDDLKYAVQSDINRLKRILDYG
jgi:hypothetical protein